MRVLIVAAALGPVYGGPSKTVFELAKALVKEGASVDIVATHANGAADLDVPLMSWISELDYRVQYFPYLKMEYKFSCSLTRWLFKHVCEYDVVHTNAIFTYVSLPAYWACQKHQIPYVVTPHGMLDPWALSYKAWKKKLYYSLLEAPALNRSANLHMLTSKESIQVEALGLKSSRTVIPNGIDRESFECLPDSSLFHEKFPETVGKDCILFLGRIDPKKGLDLLAKAFGELHPQFPNAHLVIAGPDNTGFLPTVESYLREAECSEAVTFTGMLNGTLKYSALSAATLYTAPSYSEGFSMSVLEGMAAGLPCVFTTECNFPEAEEEEAALIVEPDADQLAVALEKCLVNLQLSKGMGQRARNLIFDRYTWEKVASKTLSLYRSVAAA